MKLKSYRVNEFRSVWDSGDIAVDDVVCLVGKNEAGKTALLRALYKLNPVVESEGKFDITDDYPRKEIGDYQHGVEGGQREPATVVEATFELESAELAAVAKVFGEKALTSRDLTLSKGYSNVGSFGLDFGEDAARAHLIATANIPETLRSELNAADGWVALKAALAGAEGTTEVNQLRDFVAKLTPEGASSYAYNSILASRVPEFLYFDEYYQMVGHENVPALIRRKAEGKLLPSDHPMIGLVNLARLKLDDLLNVQRTIELVNKLEGAGNHLTRQILKYWSQNKHLQMRFDLREGKPEDPLHMRAGQNIWGRVHDTVHMATTELSSRSRGFVWFFSFLAWYEDVKRTGQEIILLLDEPGLSLHGRAQADLLRYIEEELKPHHQVIYTTHSPFMIDPDHFERVRIVQDRSIDATEPLPKEEDGTKVLTDVFDATDDSLFPLQGALGYDIHQTLFVGPNCLVVEGAADLLYLQGMTTMLERDGREGLSSRWTITPVGGSGKVATFVSLLAHQKGLRVGVLIDLQAKDQQSVEGLYRRKLLQKKNVHTFADFTGTADADVEDMFDRAFYLALVNGEYAPQLQAALKVVDLNAKQPRVLKAVEALLKAKPLTKGEFSHFRPARYFSDSLSALADKIDEPTRSRFEAAFRRLNALLS